MKLFHNHYELTSVIGRGGFSEVWLARDTYTDMDVAVKIYAPGQNLDSDGTLAFVGELRKVYDLNHTNLLKPHHFDVCDGIPYLVMPYCGRGSCRSLSSPVSEDIMWHFLYDVASGLSYLHRHGIIHQDVKPANILISDDDTFLLTDFGFSVESHSSLISSMIIDPASGSGGTMAYMAPERFSNNKAPVKAGDVWALGATAVELMTGSVAFGDGKLGGGLLQKGGADMPVLPSIYSAELKSLVYSMMATSPDERPSAAEVADAASVHVENKSRPAVVKSESRIGTGAIVAASVSAVVLLIVLLLVIFRPLSSSGVAMDDATVVTDTLARGACIWCGTSVDGKPNGFGVMTFRRRWIIDTEDPEMRYAESGDYIDGEYSDGHLLQGVWYDKDGKRRGLLILKE